MSGSNNIPLGPRTGARDGALAQAAASLSGQSLLNPEYLQTGGATQQSSGGMSKFGPIACKFLYFGYCHTPMFMYSQSNNN
jgi:hypothetical protein